MEEKGKGFYQCVFIALMVLTTGSWAVAATYYVSPTGSNSNPGTQAQPWATPGFGSRQLQGGDTLVILGGRYALQEFDADIITPPSGTASAWTTIRGDAGNRPVLAGRGNLLTAIDLSGKQYVRIENLEITHDSQAQGDTLFFREGIEILQAPAEHIVLKDLYIHHIDEYGINIQDVNDLQILNSRIEFCGFGALGGPAAQAGGWRNVTIKGCSLSWSGHYYQGGDGSSRPYDRPDGFGIEASAGPILIEDTVAEHNYGDGLDSKAAYTTVRRCVVANNSCDGVKLWDGPSRVENTLIYGRGDGNPTVTPWAPLVIAAEANSHAVFEIVNVTVDDALGENYLMHVQYDNPAPIQLLVRNTIFSGRGPNCPLFVRSGVNLTFDHNLLFFPQNPSGDPILFFGNQSFTCQTVSQLGAGNFCADPKFRSPAWGTSGDYHLQASSPAINAGVSTAAPASDLDGLGRDSNPDLGAYEFTGGPAPTPTPTPQPTRTPTPTPAPYPTPTPTAPPPAFRYIVPALIHAPGFPPTAWRSDLVAVNYTSDTAVITFTFYPLGGQAVSVVQSLPGFATAEWQDVLASLFQLAGSPKGTLHVASSVPLVLSARTYNQETPTRTYGQAMPALQVAQGFGASDVAVVPHLKKTQAFRTNVGVVNLGSVGCSLRVELHEASGQPVGTPRILQVPAGQWAQDDDVFTKAGAGYRDLGYATVTTQSQGCVFWAYASLVDNATGDPTTIPAMLPLANAKEGHRKGNVTGRMGGLARHGLVAGLLFVGSVLLPRLGRRLLLAKTGAQAPCGGFVAKREGRDGRVGA